MPSNWYKRRTPTEFKKINNYTVNGFVKLSDSYCTIHMVYDDCTEAELTGRVCHNAISDRWTINGINPYGDYILLEVTEQKAL